MPRDESEWFSAQGCCDGRYSQEIMNAAKRIGLTVSSYDRKEEPLEVKSKEGATIQGKMRKQSGEFEWSLTQYMTLATSGRNLR